MKTHILILNLLIVLLLACVKNGHTQGRAMQLLSQLNNANNEKIMIAAHRGDWYWAPENSLRGFQNCIDAGVDILEIDVRMTKDQIPVVIHDLTLARTTTGSGKVADWTLDSLKTLFLKDATGVVTGERIPTLEEVLRLTKGHILVYLDKSVDKVKTLLPILQKTGTLRQAIFVLDFPYQKAREQFGSYLDSVVFVPVIADGMDNLDVYVDTYISELNPKAFQFRMETADGGAYAQLDKVLTSGSKPFVAATWPKHTMGHDDQVSRTQPDKGWGWLIEQGFTILETNRPYELLTYLRSNRLHD